MASEPLHLYYFPTSFYSQKAVLALKEKQLAYRQTVVSLVKDEVSQPWYLKLNPKGQVPMLVIGDKPVTESERIVEAVDALEDGKGPRLIPDQSSTQGKLVAEWRKKIDAIPAEDITFGVILNKELHTPDLKVPQALIRTREAYTKSMKEKVLKLEALKQSDPDLREALDTKIAKAEARASDCHLELGHVEGMLVKVAKTFDEVEVQLKNNKAGGSTSNWICGEDFSAADINLCVLLGRLNLVGYLNKYLDPQKRPALVDYWRTAQTRKTVKETISNAMRTVQKEILKSYIPKVAGGAVLAGAVILIGVVLAKKYS